jgi:hypothetical protein
MTKRFAVSAGVFISLALILAFAVRPTRPHQSTLAVSPIAGSASSSIQASGTPPSSSSTKQSGVPPEWQILKVDQYRFQVSYPRGWLLTKNVTDANNAYPTRYFANLVSTRPDASGQEMTVPFVIAAYDAPSVPISQWLDRAYHTNVDRLEKGSIETVLANSYAIKPGLVYDDAKKGSLDLYELGSSGPDLDYATYITSRSSTYVYLIEMQLPLGVAGGGSQPDEYDKAFLEFYKKMISSFVITE